MHAQLTAVLSHMAMQVMLTEVGPLRMHVISR